MKKLSVPIKYLPKSLSKKDKRSQLKMLNKSRKLYKKNKFYTRSKVSSYKNKTSNHIVNARRIYKINTITPNKQLSAVTGCSLSALKHIVKKGEGAYYSSGSRPNQTPQSWGLARLASSITGGKSAAVDYSNIYTGCKHNKRAFRLATQSRKKNKYGQRLNKKTTIKV